MASPCGIFCQEITFLCQDVGQGMVRGRHFLSRKVIGIHAMTILCYDVCIIIYMDMLGYACLV